MFKNWLTSPLKRTPEFAEAAKTVCGLYLNAFELKERNVHLVCVDEKTGIQALERLVETRPARPANRCCENTNTSATARDV